jgi:hypothetical protein
MILKIYILVYAICVLAFFKWLVLDYDHRNDERIEDLRISSLWIYSIRIFFLLVFFIIWPIHLLVMIVRWSQKFGSRHE